MFLTGTGVAPAGEIDHNGEKVQSCAYENGFETVFCPADAEGCLYGYHEVLHQSHQTTAPALGKEQGQPHHR